jgi:hypothetical protein
MFSLRGRAFTRREASCLIGSDLKKKWYVGKAEELHFWREVKASRYEAKVGRLISKESYGGFLVGEW